MYGIQNGEIPSVGKVDLTWVQQPLPPVNLPQKTSAPVLIASEADDVNMEEGDAMASSSPGHATRGQEQQNLDYDVADDAWDDI